ncbi:Rieske (2Fe-2S) protein [Methylovorus glucosotrophus]|uniref:Rieske (2Fe-2S) domain protein n=1 Tax=Methylovorus glucosotrophus (strain SIP3-4) TaxID=582744 RepID=C6XD88_METGS|nr:Rieske 2Fe-2S domain-containing protein [Methylovorus glucosotrophus]ACT50513.1 Rieske (2Fe-2S) domain protein [Methylovorus glucosotrophus SIP3-4]KAF0844082.1 nitrite reductase/ring-hydroxylating ferredoxin subunit [Methylovorus glucosotrophus]
MADNERLICESASLLEKGQGVRFELPEFGQRVTGFVVRYKGKVCGFINQCAHVPVELDWNPGDFFDLTQQYIICATHGAHFMPDNGYCVMGPCKGRSLKQLPVFERDSFVFINLESLKHV